MAERTFIEDELEDITALVGTIYVKVRKIGESLGLQINVETDGGINKKESPTIPNSVLNCREQLEILNHCVTDLQSFLYGDATVAKPVKKKAKKT